ncbi:MAG: copper ion binding protein [Lachnospiraceae bacterium]|nr:copper ion binding protein [Lachnospiraceae bacterium]
MEKTVLNVEGMSCEHCVKAVSEAVGALTGVVNVGVDLAAGTVAVEFDPAVSPLEEIIAEIEDVGYDVIM